MKESFNELYTRLYKENFEELEEKRKKEYNMAAGIVGIIILMVMARYDNIYSKSFDKC